MIDLIQIQKDLYGLLMSAPQLATVNIVEERKFILEKTVEVDAIWQTIRPLNGTGYFGNGLLIETPEVICDSNGVSGPPQIVILSFVSFQNGDAAFTPATPGAPAGGGLFAEQIEQYLIDILHLLTLGGIGTMQVTGHFSEPARDYPGINARRTKINFTPSAKPQQTLRTAIVTVAINAGQATLTTTTARRGNLLHARWQFPKHQRDAGPHYEYSDQSQFSPIRGALRRGERPGDSRDRIPQRL